MNILSLRDCRGGPGPAVTQYRVREKGEGVQEQSRLPAEAEDCMACVL